MNSYFFHFALARLRNVTFGAGSEKNINNQGIQDACTRIVFTLCCQYGPLFNHLAPILILFAYLFFLIFIYRHANAK